MMKTLWKILFIVNLILVASSIFTMILSGPHDHTIVALCFALIALVVASVNVYQNYKDDRTIRCFDCGSEWIRIRKKSDMKYAKDVLYILGWVRYSDNEWVCRNCAHARRCPDEVSAMDS